VRDLADLVIELTGKDLGIVRRPLPEDDPKMRRPVIDVARRELGFEPKVALREGLVRTIAHFDQVLRERRHVCESAPLLLRRMERSRSSAARGNGAAG